MDRNDRVNVERFKVRRKRENPRASTSGSPSSSSLLKPRLVLVDSSEAKRLPSSPMSGVLKQISRASPQGLCVGAWTASKECTQGANG